MDRQIKGYINSEDASDHWRFLPVENETILDLGCGINNQEHLPTPMYFIQNKAKLVVGIDPSEQSYQWFKTNFWMKNFINVMDYIDRIEKFELYLGYYKPTVLKIDVEGGELFLNGLDGKYLEGIRHIGIEFHNLPCLISCERLLKDNGYEIEYYKFPHLDIDHQGVIHAHKKNITIKTRENVNITE
jgi:hypothetical protein